MSTLQANPDVIKSVVAEVLSRLSTTPLSASPSTAGEAEGRFCDVNRAIAAAKASQQKLATAGLDIRDGIVKLIKQIALDNAEAWGRFELNETKVGRLDAKIGKLQGLPNVPGVEFLRAHGTTAHSGDAGVSLDEAAPWGVIGVITPVTHSIPTMTANAINMIAAGNSMVVNAHPSGHQSALLAAKAFNQAIQKQFGIGPLLCLIDPPTIESANTLFEHPDVAMLVVTGGPAVARAAMKLPKRSVVAGPGNPPVLVDASADLDTAAEAIIFGGAFDNNLLCIGEKEVFVVESVFEPMMRAMDKAGAVRLDNTAVARLTEKAFAWKDNHYAVQKSLVGKDASVLAEAAGVSVPSDTPLLFGVTPEDHPFVYEEQMMPFLPFVKVKNFDEGLKLCIKHEHGFGHTAIIHSNNLKNITAFGQAMNTTIVSVNGPSTASLGIKGEGYASFSIATPTGEGITTPLTFTRFRRVAYAGSLRII